ncbi:espin-like [Pollicipes pollicipes]|uniref:espin-like n=1 Tax=Pollicipes pollicipes TaxID=41117 RepID=UPI001885105A|nr:espin-like [Pollicipes pollicipes]
MDARGPSDDAPGPAGTSDATGALDGATTEPAAWGEADEGAEEPLADAGRQDRPETASSRASRPDRDAPSSRAHRRPLSANSQMENAVTPVYLAAQEGHLEVLRYLVDEQGGSLTLPAKDGMAPVHASAQMGCLSCLKWMVLEKDVDVNMPAANAHMVRWLLRHGSKIVLDKYGKSPINDAAENERIECLSLLVQHGTDPDYDLDEDTDSGRQSNTNSHPCCCREKTSAGDSSGPSSPRSTESASSHYYSGGSSNGEHSPFYLHRPLFHSLTLGSEQRSEKKAPRRRKEGEKQKLKRAAPAPPPAAAGPPLVAISANELQKVQLRKTDKLTKTYSAPVGCATGAPAGGDLVNVQRKDDLIAELKRSKDMDGVRKLREERAKSAVQILREESKELVREFTADAFLSEIPEVDATGNTIPAWKRQMLARKAAERAKTAAEEQRLKDLEKQKIQSLPPWKRQLIARKEEEDSKRSHGP